LENRGPLQRGSRKNRFPDLNLPQPLSEMEAAVELDSIASANATTRDFICFLGAGAYQHYIPAAVDNLLQRGEFYTFLHPLSTRNFPGHASGNL